MIGLRLIADDLTGALDSAAQFTSILGPLLVLTGPDGAQPPDSFIVNLSSRDGTTENAIMLSRQTSRFFRGADIAFKKIDSLLRGHWAAELAAIIETGMFERVILAPAFPAQGRLTIDGVQVVARPDGQFQHVDNLVTAVGSARSVAQAGGTGIIVADAKSDADLADIVARFRSAPGTLWCGAAGLAQALAGMPPLPIRPQGTSHLVLVGSYHSVACSQLERYAALFPELIVRFQEDGPANAESIRQIMRRHGTCIAVPANPSGQSSADAALLIDKWMGKLVRHLEAPSILTVVGGETFASLCRHVDAKTLSVEGECEPGIPVSRITAGNWHGTMCLSKSGAFGDPEWLLRHTSMLQEAPLP